MDNPQEKVLLEWTAPSRLFRPRSRQFFTTAMTVLILVSIVLGIAGEWMLIATLVALSFAYYIWSTISPEMASYAFTSRGLRTSNHLVLWTDMVRWWKEEKWGQELVIIDTPQLFPPRVHLILEAKNHKQIVDLLTQHLLMEKLEPTRLDKFGTWIATKFPFEHAS